MLAFDDDIGQFADSGDIRAERPRRHLAVQDQGGDVRIIGRDLTPALPAAFIGNPDEADEFRTKSLDTLDFHRLIFVV